MEEPDQVSASIPSTEARAILDEWCETRRSLWAALFDRRGMQRCAGQVASVSGEAAVITDSVTVIHIPYASAGDCAVATLNHETKSLTLTWRSGASAFIVTRSDLG